MDNRHSVFEMPLRKIFIWSIKHRRILMDVVSGLIYFNAKLVEVFPPTRQRFFSDFLTAELVSTNSAAGALTVTVGLLTRSKSDDASAVQMQTISVEANLSSSGISSLRKMELSISSIQFNVVGTDLQAHLHRTNLARIYILISRRRKSVL